jgi:guanosine-3',5'-bis(diphosphate) 3'-pyrophosphohydrolase
MPENPLHTLLSAVTFAAVKHGGQKRGDNFTPYVAHLTRVTLIASSHFGLNDSLSLTAAMLHDVLEDTDTDYDEISGLFGDEVADAVAALTKNTLLPKKERERDYQERLLKAPENIRILKLADIFDNLTSRRGTPRILRTLENTRGLLASFRNTFETERGKRAYKIVMDLHTDCSETA